MVQSLFGPHENRARSRIVVLYLGFFLGRLRPVLVLDLFGNESSGKQLETGERDDNEWGTSELKIGEILAVVSEKAAKCPTGALNRRVPR